MSSIEFAGASVGQANDILRQAAEPGTIPMTASQSGRLGYEATGSAGQVGRVAALLSERGEEYCLS